MRLTPQVIRDKLLGVLYSVYPEALTLETLCRETGVSEKESWPELQFLIDMQSVEVIPSYGLVAGDKSIDTPATFKITTAGRTSVEEKQRPRAERKPKGARLNRGAQDIKQAERLIADAQSQLQTSERLSIEGNPSGSLDHAQAGLEMAVKALFPLAGYQVPMEHGLGSLLEGLVSALEGNQGAVEQAGRNMARAGWLSDVSELLHQVSRYGFLQRSAREIVRPEDADYWRKQASDVVANINVILWQVKSGDLKFT